MYLEITYALYIFGINHTMAGIEYFCPKTLACNIACVVTIFPQIQKFSNSKPSEAF